ncbi:EAL domain-containing protein [Sphingomonas sp. AR_OL41]|uniref:bifunctional diguanylate cyclase/phosphodiesterase n=1 Tax=Sphingomonas sp. AR_OL41 TaxID=3042729 RepID=UPI0024813FBF|nr:EAL domain-containing protein [Sphingomonas sp. AR_OL41]MDH7974410.1 EAL domain-containing protein [Sphingomonas sp. AR_OL41]
MSSLKAPVSRSADIAALHARLREIAPLAGAPGDGALLPASASELLEALPVAVYATDAAGRITFCNAAATTLWGQSPAPGEAYWCGAWKRYDRAGCEAAPGTSALERAMHTAAPTAPVESVIERADGTRTPVASHPILFRDAAGQVTGALCLVTDLTEIRRVERILHETEEDHRDALGFSPRMDWTADPRCRMLTTNARWFALTGQTERQALGHGWKKMVNPHDVRAIDAAMLHSATTGLGFDVRFRVRVIAGGERWFRARGRIRRDQAGNILRWNGSFEDINDTVLAERARLDAEERYRLVALAAADVVWDFDAQNDVVTWSDALEHRFSLALDGGRSPQAWWRERIHPDDRARVVAAIVASVRGPGINHAAEYRFRRGDGSYAHVADRASLIRNDQGRVVRAIGAMVDVSERKRAEEMLQASEERFRLAATAAELGIADIDLVQQREHWSAELRNIFGVTSDARGSSELFASLVHPDDRAAAVPQYGLATLDVADDRSLKKFRIVRPIDAGVRWLISERHVMRDTAGAATRLIITYKDITAEKTAQDRIAWAASHDALTGLANRLQYNADLEVALKRARIDKTAASLLLIDLDNFKQINNRLGHPAGDATLVGFARRMAEAMPPAAHVARIGGDEFAAILPGHDATAALAIATDLLRRLDQPLPVGTTNVDLRASIGIATFPVHGGSPATLVQSADLALYSAKDAGRGVAHVFKRSLRAHRESEIAMLNHARTAIANHWLQPLYQPKIALASGRIAGFEALLRWRDARAGLHAPASIAHAFDDTELAGHLGDAISELIFTDMRDWLQRGVAFGKIALNASPAEFRRPDYAGRLLARLARFGVPAAMVELEITETALLDESAGTVLFALDQVRAAGITVALDDFGTGFSSLSHLRHFAVDTIKIDRSFVAGIGRNASDQAIVEAVFRLGDALGMSTVAEGIETRAQADFVRLHGCTHAQGYLFAPALDAARIPDLLARGIDGPGGDIWRAG